jgi:hypothetical protein
MVSILRIFRQGHHSFSNEAVLSTFFIRENKNSWRRNLYCSPMSAHTHTIDNPTVFLPLRFLQIKNRHFGTKTFIVKSPGYTKLVVPNNTQSRVNKKDLIFSTTKKGHSGSTSSYNDTVRFSWMLQRVVNTVVLHDLLWCSFAGLSVLSCGLLLLLFLLLSLPGLKKVWKI